MYSQATLQLPSKSNNCNNRNEIVIKKHSTLSCFLNLSFFQISVAFDKTKFFFSMHLEINGICPGHQMPHMLSSMYINCPTDRIVFLKIKTWSHSYTALKSLYHCIFSDRVQIYRSDSNLFSHVPVHMRGKKACTTKCIWGNYLVLCIILISFTLWSTHFFFFFSPLTVLPFLRHCWVDLLAILPKISFRSLMLLAWSSHVAREKLTAQVNLRHKRAASDFGKPVCRTLLSGIWSMLYIDTF